MRHSYTTAHPNQTPRVEAVFPLADGRNLQIAQWGPPDGVPVVFFHGTPGSRLLCPDLDATERAGVRFISFDRPGYGRSDPRPGLECCDVVSDVVDILDHLGIDSAAMIGWSGGGKYALACGALAQDRVTAVAAVCSDGEPLTERDLPPEIAQIAAGVRRDPVANRDGLRARSQWLADDPHLLLRLTEQSDPEVLQAPGMRETFVAWMQEAAAISTEGYVDDRIVNVRPWGFQLQDITVPVFSWFGEHDGVVGRHHAELHAARIPNCQSFGCPDCSHFVPIAHFPQILEQLA